MDKTYGIGALVLSTKGRDKGGYFMVYDIIDKDYVLIVDGKIRKISSPKKKKIKHLKLYGTVLSELLEKKLSEQKITDKQVRLAITKVVQNSDV